MKDKGYNYILIFKITTNKNLAFMRLTVDMNEIPINNLRREDTVDLICIL